MLIAGAEIEGAHPLDVRCEGGVVAEVGRLERRPGEPVLEAAGGALLPGLHDHHLHLFALAAAASSQRCGPPAVRDADALARSLAAAPGDDWVRGVGYHEEVAGELDRARLDALGPARPLRIQHRSGSLWIVNSLAVERLGLDRGEDAAGVERDAAGRATGRLYGLDAWLRERLPPAPPPDLAPVGRRLARCGVTGVTDATPDNGAAALAAFAAAVESGALPQQVLLMGSPQLPPITHPGLARGAVKVRLSERDLPEFDDFVGVVREAHAGARPVAVHCVTRAELVLALAVFAEAGSHPGDRIEHASVAPPALVRLLAERSLTVVTQPNFVRERGDAYLRDVEPDELPWLYPCRSLLDAGVPVGGGTDAPFGDPDPWLAMRAAVDRRSGSGAVLGEGERVSPERALALFTSPAHAPGGAPRRVVPGATADLCLLARPWSRSRETLSADDVVATLRAGRLVWSSNDPPA